MKRIAMMMMIMVGCTRYSSKLAYNTRTSFEVEKFKTRAACEKRRRYLRTKYRDVYFCKQTTEFEQWGSDNE